VIRFGRGELRISARGLRSAGRAFLLSSPAVLRVHGESIRAALPRRGRVEIAFDDGETSKSLETLRGVLDDALAAGLRRDDFIVAAGGGTVTDLAGFAAAVLLRGIAWYAVPTTLLGMADAAIGGKTGVDHPAGKNLVGAFHPPQGVLIDPDFLSTLPPRRFREGVVEIYKTLLIGSGEAARKMAGRLEAIAGSRDADPFLEEAIRVKSAIVERDPRERGERRVLNFGHTFGHAIEAAGGFSRWSHGEAVAIGAAAALRLSASLAGFPEETAAALARELVAFAGGVGALPKWDGRTEEFLSRDKKNTAAGRLMIPRRLGSSRGAGSDGGSMERGPCLASRGLIPLPFGPPDAL
jgi:3-dehydroquinate synthetase